MSLQSLSLDLHVYTEAAEGRFVFVNLNRYREGERLREGPLVEQITPDGVILQHMGERFLVPRS
jgi:general secretion pathway protein B